MQRQRRDERQAVIVNRNQAGKRVSAYQRVRCGLGGGAVFGGELGWQVHGLKFIVIMSLRFTRAGERMAVQPENSIPSIQWPIA